MNSTGFSSHELLKQAASYRSNLWTETDPLVFIWTLGEPVGFQVGFSSRVCIRLRFRMYWNPANWLDSPLANRRPTVLRFSVFLSYWILTVPLPPGYDWSDHRVRPCPSWKWHYRSRWVRQKTSDQRGNNLPAGIRAASNCDDTLSIWIRRRIVLSLWFDLQSKQINQFSKWTYVAASAIRITHWCN